MPPSKITNQKMDQFLQTPKAKVWECLVNLICLRHVKNQFLEEQEALYNKMDYVGDVILQMKDRDHVVFTYNNESQFKEIINTHVNEALIAIRSMSCLSTQKRTEIHRINGPSRKC